MYRNLHARSLRRPGEEVPEEGDQFDKFKGQIFTVDLAHVNGQTEVFEGRQWLEKCLKNNDYIGWSVEWQPDRQEGADHPIALMQFATSDTALLLRTHHTRNWLPAIVDKMLMGTECKKVGVGVEGACKQKMQTTFNFFPAGVVDLAEVARQKGVEAQGLKALGEHFNLRIRKAERIARSDWHCDVLSKEQQQYAAEDAYFAYILREKLDDLEDLEEDKGEGYDNINQGVLQIKKEWEGIIKRKADGLWCMLCDKGPMNVPMIVERHIEGKKHQQKVEASLGVIPGAVPGVKELPEKFIAQGIIAGDDINGVKIGQYKCKLCNTGAISTIEAVEQHIATKRHIKAMAPKVNAAASPAPAAEPGDPFGGFQWNFPAYVKPDEDGKSLACELCLISNMATPMRMHLGGKKHGDRCRARGHEEMMYVKERDRLEYVLTGAPVVREGFKAPRVSKLPKSSTADIDDEPDSKAPSSQANDLDNRGRDDTSSTPGNGNHDAVTSTGQNLPEGWKEQMDEASGCLFYFHPESGTAQWERPSDASGQKPVPQEPLPEGWKAYQDPKSEEVYYYNEISQASTWERPTAASAKTQSSAADTEPAPGLPPGWTRVWCRQSHRYYYADIVSQNVQWTEPSAYVHQPWSRGVDPGGKAFWRCTGVAVEEWFYEGDEPWTRLLDDNQRVFWMNSSTGRRFFEKPPIC